MPLIKPGVYDNLTNEEYHGDKEYYSSSQIKKANGNMAYFKHYVLDKNIPEKKTSTSKLFGTLIHTLLLEKDEFFDRYHVYEGPLSKDGKPLKKHTDKLKELYPNKDIITPSQYEKALRIEKNVQNYKQASDLIYHKNGHSELSVFAKDEDSGLNLKVRADKLVISDDFNAVIDVKTAKNPDLEGFTRDAFGKYGYGYDVSAFMYTKVISEHYQRNFDFYFVVIGTSCDLNPVAVYKMSEDRMQKAKEKFFKAVNNIKNAELFDEYEYQNEVEEI